MEGFFIGNFLYVIIYKMSDWESYSGAISFCSAFTVLFGLLMWCFRRSMMKLKLTIAFLGSILVVRGISLLVGGYPIDTVQWALLRNDMPLEIYRVIYIYLPITVMLSLFFFCWLNAYSFDNCD